MDLNVQEETIPVQENSQHRIPEKKKKHFRNWWKWIPGPSTLHKCLVLAGFVCIIGIVIFGWRFFHREGSKTPAVSTITASTIMDILEISDLSTVDYQYQAITTVYDMDTAKAKYHVFYEGNIKAGIDFEKIDIQIDEAEKKIKITLPQSEIQQTLVDEKSLDFIFEKNRYDKEMVYQEAYTACCKDLAKRMQSDEMLLKMAGENAKAAVEALLLPFMAQLEEQYQVEIG